MLVSVYSVLVKCKHMTPWLVWYWYSSGMSGPGLVRVSSGKVKSSWQINFVTNEIYSHVAAEVIETWYHTSLKMSNSDAVSKNIIWSGSNREWTSASCLMLWGRETRDLHVWPMSLIFIIFWISVHVCKLYISLTVRMTATSFIGGKAANKLWSCSFKL